MHPLRRSTMVGLVCVCVTVALAADAAWTWSGAFGDKAVELLIIGDVQMHTRRADPARRSSGCATRWRRPISSTPISKACW